MKKKKTTKCPKCDHPLNAASFCFGEDAKKPSEGDVTACAGCGTLLVFRKDLRLRPPTEGELAEFLFGWPLQQMRQVVEAAQ